MKIVIRKKKPKFTKTRALAGCPIKRGVCYKLLKIKPKKPNSAQRKIAKVKLSNDKFITAFVPGGNHNLQQHSVVLVRGGNVKDLPGVNYKLIRGSLDLDPLPWRKNSRSKYGTSKI